MDCLKDNLRERVKIQKRIIIKRQVEFIMEHLKLELTKRYYQEIEKQLSP